MPRDKKILLIEDDDSIREALWEIFSSEGYSVSMAENGREALDALSELKPDLIFLDLMMPLMDGREFLRALKTQGDSSLTKIPLVLMTAAGGQSVQGLSVDEVISKPVDIDKLLQVAKKFCA